MTATPIPRTAAMTVYGDLDMSLLTEKPGGRKEVKTHWANGPLDEIAAWSDVRDAVAAGHQAYVVCPLIEESEKLEVASAEQTYERLRTGELADLRLGLVHGRLPSAEKEAVMARFRARELDVLVATTVIEVGVDVPNATVMLVEDAERYGISQLHQLRGRVGRGAHRSLCLLFGPKESARLRALAEHSDGFRLAEIDLRLRGEGELTGTRQSGAPAFRYARLPEDAELLERARAGARDILDADPALTAPEHVPLLDALRDAHGATDRVAIPA
jgi:ATP-dependent DNA helicase RecG